MEKKASLLYVEDDTTLSFVTRDNLEMKGYAVDYCEDGVRALEMINEKTYDLCILDVMLPKMDGFTLASSIREKNQEIPILFLTARSAREDRIFGLQLGADDYITKPFSIEELLLKIEIFLKRSKILAPPLKLKSTITLGQFLFAPANQQLSGFGESLTLTRRENELLLHFAENMNQVIKREDLLIKVWGNDHFFASRSLDVFISRLRKMLKADPGLLIENIHNVGYRMKVIGGEQFK